MHAIAIDPLLLPQELELTRTLFEEILLLHQVNVELTQSLKLWVDEILGDAGLVADLFLEVANLILLFGCELVDGRDAQLSLILHDVQIHQTLLDEYQFLFDALNRLFALLNVVGVLDPLCADFEEVSVVFGLVHEFPYELVQILVQLVACTHQILQLFKAAESDASLVDLAVEQPDSQHDIGELVHLAYLV